MTHRLSQLVKYIGKRGKVTFVDGRLPVGIVVDDIRFAFGRIDVRIRNVDTVIPHSGGWVDIRSVTFE